MIGRLVSVAGLAVVLAACSAARPTTQVPVMADTFFSGHAFIDSNGNGQVDSGDVPLEGATFIVDVQGAQFGAKTDATGTAFVTVPGSVQRPVILTMQPPKDTAYVLIGPARVVGTSPTDKADFLFRSK